MHTRQILKATIARGGAVVLQPVALVLLGLVSVGCQATGDVNADLGPVPQRSNIELVEYLGEMPLVNAEAAYRATYIAWRGEVFTGEFDALRQKLIDERLAAAIWHYGPRDYLYRGDAAYLLCRAYGINTGVSWNLMPSGRYAYRELAYRRIVRPASELSFMSGGEFQGMLRKIEQWRVEGIDGDVDLGSPDGS